MEAMVAVAVLALALAPQGKVILKAYMPGQREVVLGALPYRNTMMPVCLQKDVPPDFSGTGVAPGGYVDRQLGWVRWSVKPDRFADKDCMQVRCEGELTENVQKAKVTIKQVRNTWVAADGQILRQYDVQLGPGFTREATSIFHKDSIDITVSDERGRRVSTVYPNVTMAELNAQFTPMMKGADVLLREKEFYVFDPFTGASEKHTARIAGSVTGEAFHRKFQGKAFEITGPLLRQTAAISVEGDLVRVELPQDRFIVMSQVPAGMVDERDELKVGG